MVRTREIQPFCFSKPNITGVCLPSLPVWVPCAWDAWCEGLFFSPRSIQYLQPRSLPWTTLQFHLAPHHFSFLPALLSVASSLHFPVESLFCQSSGNFLGYLHWNECFLIVSLGGGELRVFLLKHLPKLSRRIFLSLKTESQCQSGSVQTNLLK